MLGIFLLTRYFLMTIVTFFISFWQGFICPVLRLGLVHFTTALLATHIDTFQEIKLVINISFSIFSGVQFDLFFKLKAEISFTCGVKPKFRIVFNNFLLCQSSVQKKIIILNGVLHFRGKYV